MTEEEKQKARQELLASGYPDHDWWEPVYEDAKAIGRLMGIEIADISFDDHCATFRGIFDGKLDAAQTVRTYAPQDTDLHAIVDTLTALVVKRRLQYGLLLGCVVRQHRQTLCTIETHLGEADEYGIYDGPIDWDNEHYDDDDSSLEQSMRAFADWIHKQLMAEYNYLTSDEQLDLALSIC